MLIFDGHSDLLTDITSRRLKGDRDIFLNRHEQKLRRGGVGALIAVVWIDPPYDVNPPERMLQILKNGFADLYPLDRVAFPVRNAVELDKAVNDDKIAVVLGMEGLDGLEDDPDGIYFLHELGLRHASLTWNSENSFATGVRAQKQERGLTIAGKRAVKIMEELGILLDVSHADEKTFWDVINAASGPVIASHSNAYKICPAARNLKDEQIKAIAESGGVIGMNAWPEFVDEKYPSVEKLIDHVDYIVEKVGIDHVSFGFDFTDFLEDDSISSFQVGDTAITPGLKGADDIPNIINGLLKRGYTKEDLNKIAYLNLRNLFARVTGK